MEAKLPAGWILESLKIPLLTTTHKNIHLEVFFPLRKGLQLAGPEVLIGPSTAVCHDDS